MLPIDNEIAPQSFHYYYYAKKIVSPWWFRSIVNAVKNLPTYINLGLFMIVPLKSLH